MAYYVKDVARLVGGELIGNGDVPVTGINGIKEAGPNDLAFIIHPDYAPLINISSAGAVIVPRMVQGIFNKPVIKVDNPSVTFSKIIDAVMPDRIPHPKGVHASAVISKKAVLGKNVGVGAYAVIEDGAVIGDDTRIYPFCYVGNGTRIGRNCVIYPNVTIREAVTLCDRVIIHPGSVIGSDGFGYDILKDGTAVKIPQLGTVVIEDDAEIGACVTVDRARFNKTVIGKGSKIDNQVQIAHNVTLGQNCILAAQTGIAGSSTLGRNVILGGKVGVSDHVKLGDFVKAGAGTGIHKSYPANTVLFWYPSKPVEKARELLASIGLLPKLFERVKALEAKLKELENK